MKLALAVVTKYRESRLVRLPDASVCLGLGISVAEELQGGAAEEHVRAERRPGQQGADRGRRHVVPDEAREARVRRLHEVPGVRLGSRPIARVEAVGRDLRVCAAV